MHSIARPGLATFFAPLALAASSTASVLIVDASGTRDYRTIQAAVDASTDGDVILVHAGTYAAFHVSDRSLSIYVDAGATVNVNGTVQIMNLAATRTFVLSGVNIQGSTLPAAPAPGLRVTNDLGRVLIQNVVIDGGSAPESCEHPVSGAPAVISVGSLELSFTACYLNGGTGSTNAHCEEDYGGNGGEAFVSQGSAVAMYDSHCLGGPGGLGGHSGGIGGAGAHFLDGGGFASGTAFEGGGGGQAWDYRNIGGGSGGDGLVLDTNAGLHDLGSTFAGGAGGTAPGPQGAHGDGVSGPGYFHDLGGYARRVVAPVSAQSGGMLTLVVYGLPGDEVRILTSWHAAFAWTPSWNGVREYGGLVELPFDPIGTIPSWANLTLNVPVPALPPGCTAASLSVQGLITSAAGTNYLATPIRVLVQ